jgi:hypothetical protein
VKKLRSSPSPTVGYNFPSIAKYVWNDILKADECLWKSYQTKDIIVPENCEVENGVLGLDRDVYLSLVKFLDSSIVRKVLLNISVLLNFLFLL